MATRARGALPDAPRGLDPRAIAGRLLPTRASLAVGLVLAAAGAGAYGAARSTSTFAVTALDVRGAPPGLAEDVRAALRPYRGRSLLALDGRAVEARVADLPFVAAVELDRAFPHTLVVRVRPERPAAVLRRGVDGWLVSERGRVLKVVPGRARPGLPRVWVPRGAPVEVGALLRRGASASAVSTLAAVAAADLPVRARAVTAAGGEVTVVLAGGLELRLGSPRDARLKLAVARQLVPALAPPGRGGPTYVDLALPSRVVAGGRLKSKVEVEGSPGGNAAEPR